MTNRQEKRRKEREEEEKMMKFYPLKIFDEDTGQSIDFLSGYCLWCNDSEPTLVTLAEWSHEQKRLLFTVTGRSDIDGEETFDFYCYACGVRQANTDVMKRFVEFADKEKGKMIRFPDEDIGSKVKDFKANHPQIMEHIRMMEDDPEGIKNLNSVRYSKTYKAYPASLSDEDRMFMTFFSWNVRFGHIANALPEDEAYREWMKLMKAEGVPDGE